MGEVFLMTKVRVTEPVNSHHPTGCTLFIPEGAVGEVIKKLANGVVRVRFSSLGLKYEPYLSASVLEKI